MDPAFPKDDPFVSPTLTGHPGGPEGRAAIPGGRRRGPGGRQYRGAVDKREALGSWLDGPRAAAEQMGADFGYRGERLGLPREGSGSIAPVGRRIAALFVDWALCLLIAYGLLAHGSLQAAENWTFAIFGVVSLLALATAGTTPGKRLLRLRVVRLDGGRPGLGSVLLRTVLLLLVVPAAVWDRDTRGMHDKAARSVEIRM
jgi:RDD family